MRRRHKGFILVESLISLSISLMVVLTLTYCINEQFKLLNNWEERVNAHKIMLLNLKNNNIPNPLIIKNQEYYFFRHENKFEVKVNKNVYQMEF